MTLPFLCSSKKALHSHILINWNQTFSLFCICSRRFPSLQDCFIGLSWPARSASTASKCTWRPSAVWCFQVWPWVSLISSLVFSCGLIVVFSKLQSISRWRGPAGSSDSQSRFCASLVDDYGQPKGSHWLKAHRHHLGLHSIHIAFAEMPNKSLTFGFPRWSTRGIRSETKSGFWCGQEPAGRSFPSVRCPASLGIGAQALCQRPVISDIATPSLHSLPSDQPNCS